MVESAEARKEANYYGGDDFDWHAYHAFRPEYPQRLFDLLFTYHERTDTVNSPRWGLAADFGSGPGTVVPPLLTRFQKVIASDLNQTQIDLGRKMLIPKYGEDRVEMHIGKAEQCDWLEDGTVDMITAAEAVHWFDADKWVEQASRKLRSGGTIAFWLYMPTCALISPVDPRLIELFTKLSFMLTDAYTSHPVTPERSLKSVFSQFKSVGLDPSLFEHEQRHYWLFSDDVRGPLGLGDVTKIKRYNSLGELQNNVSPNAELFHHAPEPDQGTDGKDCAGYLMQRGPWTMRDLDSYIETLGLDFCGVLTSKEYLDLRNAIEDGVGGKEGTFYVAFATFAVFAKRR